TIVNGLTDGLHTVQIRAIDPAGNADPSPASWTWHRDSNAPTAVMDDPGRNVRATVSLTSSVNDPTSNGYASGLASATFQSAADGGSGIDHVDFQSSPAGANTWSTVASDTTSPYSVPFDTTSVADGHYDLRTVAVDVAGNQASSTPVTNRLVDNTSPNATMNDPSTAGGYVRGTITLTSST